VAAEPAAARDTLPRWRRRLADALGLGAVLCFLLDAIPPELLLLPTITAGGDTPCHYPTAVAFAERLLPELRLHGWYAGSYLGHPLLLYYFPLPYLVMAGLAPLVGMPVAFKLGTVIPVLLLPLEAYVAFRLMRFRFPAPLLAAAAATVFLWLEENPIWGGTLASTLAGEFAYTWGIGLAVLYLGFVYRAYSRGASPWGSGALLGLVAFAHGYAVLWAGLSSSHFLFASRRPARTLLWLLGVAAVAFAFAGLWLLPLLGDWGWTTPFNDAWIDVRTRNVVPPYLAPLLVPALLGWLWSLTLARRRGGADQRLLLLLTATAFPAALAAAGPALGVIDVRFLPFAQLAACLAGAAVLGVGLAALRASDLAALGMVVAAIVYADSSSSQVRFWAEWNYSGLESKELWPAWSELTERLSGDLSDPRVAIEYSEVHERAGSIRMYETFAHFAGRATLEGVYNQASLNTHAVYYLASELGERSPNPFRYVEFSEFDTDNALRHLRLFHVSDIVALSEKLQNALAARDDVEPRFEVPPYSVFRLRDPGRGHVVPLRYAPVRSSPRGWRDKAQRWFSRKPLSEVHLVFTEDPRFEVVETDEWLPPPAVPLEGGVEVSSRVGEESIEIETSRVGHPLLVKVSWHPRWRARGADGPWRVSPALMLVIPRESRVRLDYVRRWSDHLGLALTPGVLVLLGLGRLRRRRRPLDSARRIPVVPSFVATCDHPDPPRRWGGLIPLALLAAFCLLRLVPGPELARAAEAERLEELTRAATEAGRWADAAEYARHAISRRRGQPEEVTLSLERGRALLRAGDAERGAELLRWVVGRASEAPVREAAIAALAGAGLGTPPPESAPER
jgi:hypothetical protein